MTVVPVALSTPAQVRGLREQRLDLAFGWSPELAPDLDRLLVAREPLLAVLPLDDPLAARRPSTRRTCPAGRSSSRSGP